MISWIVLVYGLLVAIGGIMGYVKASSMESLIAGCGSGLILAGAAFLMARGSYQAGWWVALIVSLLLLGRFGNAAISGGFKMMPGGLVIIMSLIVIAALLMNRR
jgi:uncharacterized membrane protein (UPF0136 family)